jgi:HEAT repeat protein
MAGMIVFLSMALSFQEDKDLESVLRLFHRGYSSSDPKARASAVTELSKSPHEKTLQKIAPLLSGDSLEVRIAAARALGNFRDYKKQATPTLVAALSASSKDLELQVAILDALGGLEDEAALPSVHQSMRGPQMKVARAALAAVASIRGKDSLPVLLDFLRDLQKWKKSNQGGGFKDETGIGEKEARKARLEELTQLGLKALQSITREPWTTLGEWELWCRKHLATFTVPR